VLVRPSRWSGPPAVVRRRLQRIGYHKAPKIAHFVLDHDLTLKKAGLKLGFVDAAEFDRIVDPRTMVVPHVATA
jgi:fumarate hydratase class II